MPPPAPAPPASLGAPEPEADWPDWPLPAALADPSPPASADALEALSDDSPDAAVASRSRPSFPAGPDTPLGLPEPEPASPEFDPDPEEAPALVAFACDAEIGCVEELADGAVDPFSPRLESDAAPAEEAAFERSPAEPCSPLPPDSPAASLLEPSDPSPPLSLSPARRPSPPSVAEPDSEPEPWELRRFAAIDVLAGEVVADASVGSARSTGSVGCAGNAGLDALEAERSILARSIRAATIGSSGFSSIGAGSLAQPATISDHVRIDANLARRERRTLAEPFFMPRASSPHALKFPAATT